MGEEMAHLLGRAASAAFVLASCLSATPGVALNPSGTTIAVIPAADAQGENGKRVLEVMGPVFMGDRVKTGPAGEVQIKFRDDTKLVVGANSLMTIDAFVFNPDDTARKVTMNALKGTFRFITGRSEKQAYSIRTPTTTIGVRGTRFDFTVEASGQTSIALFEGEARLCDRGGVCKRLRGACAMAVVRPRGGGIADVPAGPERAARIASLFPYVVSQARLQRDFRADTSSCSSRAALPLLDHFQHFSVTPITVTPPEAAPPPSPPAPSPAAGNPGNDRAVGNAGETPSDGGASWGGGTQGRGDGNTNGNAGGNGNGNAGGNVGGHGHGHDG
jgi:hypothetical protein